MQNLASDHVLNDTLTDDHEKVMLFETVFRKIYQIVRFCLTRARARPPGDFGNHLGAPPYRCLGAVSARNLIGNPTWDFLLEQGGHKVLKAIYIPGKCILHFCFVLVSMDQSSR